MTTTESPADQAELFRRLAAGYDQAIRRYQVAYDAMLELSTDLARDSGSGKSRCLDCGTGPGAALPLLLQSFDQVVAIDPSKPMLDLARLRLSSAANAVGDRVSFIEGTVQSSSESALREESFDAIHCSLVLMFVDGDAQKLEVLKFFGRLLRPGGALVLSDIVVDDDDATERARFERWKEIMSHRGADDEFVTSAVRQIDTAMHRRTVDQLLSLLGQAGFLDIEQPFRALHTAILLGRK
jgi:ubiquinone/menaquinone biosynthesis C-methylase UbiE